MIFRQSLTYLLLLIPLLAAGQQKEYFLTGYVHIKKGPTCRYNVYFKTDGNSLYGNTVTIQPDGRELNAMIKGAINTKLHTLNFRESNLPLSLDQGNCMFDVALTYKIANGKYVFSGVFTGKSEQNDSCDEGSVTLEAGKDAKDVLEKRQTKSGVQSTGEGH